MINIAEYEVKGKTYRGWIEHDNKNTIRVWFDGAVITRHKEKHRVKIPAPGLFEWGSYYCNPAKFGAKDTDIKKTKLDIDRCFFPVEDKGEQK